MDENSLGRKPRTKATMGTASLLQPPCEDHNSLGTLGCLPPELRVVIWKLVLTPKISMRNEFRITVPWSRNSISWCPIWKTTRQIACETLALLYQRDVFLKGDSSVELNIFVNDGTDERFWLGSLEISVLPRGHDKEEDECLLNTAWHNFNLLNFELKIPSSLQHTIVEWFRISWLVEFLTERVAAKGLKIPTLRVLIDVSDTKWLRHDIMKYARSSTLPFAIFRHISNDLSLLLLPVQLLKDRQSGDVSVSVNGAPAGGDSQARDCVDLWVSGRLYEMTRSLKPTIKRYATRMDIKKIHNLCSIALLDILDEAPDDGADTTDMLRLQMLANWSHRAVIKTAENLCGSHDGSAPGAEDYLWRYEADDVAGRLYRRMEIAQLLNPSSAYNARMRLDYGEDELRNYAHPERDEILVNAVEVMWDIEMYEGMYGIGPFQSRKIQQWILPRRVVGWQVDPYFGMSTPWKASQLRALIRYDETCPKKARPIFSEAHETIW